jgi:hypothetical protein
MDVVPRNENLLFAVVRLRIACCQQVVDLGLKPQQRVEKVGYQTHPLGIFVIPSLYVVVQTLREWVKVQVGGQAT